MLLTHMIEIINLLRAAHDDVKAARGKAEQFAGRDLTRDLEHIELHIDATLLRILKVVAWALVQANDIRNP